MILRGARDNRLFRRTQVVSYLVDEHAHLTETRLAASTAQRDCKQQIQFSNDAPSLAGLRYLATSLKIGRDLWYVYLGSLVCLEFVFNSVSSLLVSPSHCRRSASRREALQKPWLHMFSRRIMHSSRAKSMRVALLASTTHSPTSQMGAWSRDLPRIKRISRFSSLSSRRTHRSRFLSRSVAGCGRPIFPMFRCRLKAEQSSSRA